MERNNSVILAERLDTAAAPALHRAFLALRGRPIAIDAGAVRELGALCAQVLLAAHADRAASGLGWRITSPSAAFRDHAAALGLTDVLLAERVAP